MSRTKTFTAAAALVLAMGGGVVGGTLAVAGIAGGSQPATATLERVNEEDNTMPPPTTTPDPKPVASEAPAPAPADEAPAAVAPEPVAVPSPAAVDSGETASEAADRARREADRAKVEADRAEQASPKPAPVAVESPKPAPAPSPKVNQHGCTADERAVLSDGPDPEWQCVKTDPPSAPSKGKAASSLSPTLPEGGEG